MVKEINSADDLSEVTVSLEENIRDEESEKDWDKDQSEFEDPAAIVECADTILVRTNTEEHHDDMETGEDKWNTVHEGNTVADILSVGGRVRAVNIAIKGINSLRSEEHNDNGKDDPE